jgi:hypothetical protein
MLQQLVLGSDAILREQPLNAPPAGTPSRSGPRR